MPLYHFVHAADLHLDSPFRMLTGAAPEQAEMLRRATFDAYDGIVDLCIEQRVDALLVAGDIFDSSDNRLGAQLRFRDGLLRLAQHGIRAFVCHGNHDPLNGWRAGLDWPAEAHRFGEVPSALPLRPDDPSSPLVYGVSYPVRDVSVNLIPLFPPRDAARPAIGLLHANVGGIPGYENYAPCSLADLTATGYDYWALGHVHTRQILRAPAEGSPVVVYPGNSQGRQPNERGARGVYLVEMDERGVVTDLSFRAVDVVRWSLIECSVEDIEHDQDLLDALEASVQTELDATEGRPIVIACGSRGVGRCTRNWGVRNTLRTCARA